MVNETFTPPDYDQKDTVLDSMEIDTVGEILNISMGSAATALSTLLSRKVSITTPDVQVIPAQDLRFENLEPAIGIEIQYIDGLTGYSLLVMKRRDIKAIVNLILPDMDESDEALLDEFHVSAVSEIMNQMMGASATALASFLGKSINISTPNPFDIDEKRAEIGDSFDHPEIVTVCFTLEIEDLLKSEFMTVLSLDFTKELVQNALGLGDAEEAPPPAPQKPAPAQKPKQKPDQAARKNGATSARDAATDKQAELVNVMPVKLPSFDEEPCAGAGNKEGGDNFDLIMGVPLDISVEIGRTKMPVKNILEVRQGSIVELDRQAGDPVDIIVNGQLIAKGDVVIVDDNFGVRITDILSPKDLSSRLS